MLSYPFYFLKYFFWLIRELIGRFRKGPETLILTLSGDYPQIPVPPSNIILSYFKPPQISLYQLGEQFRLVANYPRVKTVVLHLRPLEMSLAKLDILRGYIQDLRNAGKKVVAWSYQYSLDSYYLASCADEILLLPGGEVGPLGIAREYIFLADALEKIGVKAEFVQITPYKSAGDMFTKNQMTEQVQQMGNWLVEATWNEIISAIALGRGIDEIKVREILARTPCTDLGAKQLGFVDELLAEDDLPAYLGSKDQPVNLTLWNEAMRQIPRQRPRKPGKYVAMMGIEGMIIDGNSQQPPLEPPIPIPFGFEKRAGDMSVTQVARRVLADKRAAALVVYVDSRGGSATASESMSATLRKVAEKKPVVIVMGPVAASGGYYVATPGKWIMAQPNTITGSIGVLYGKFAIGEMLKKIFINRELISRGEAALFLDPEETWSEVQRAKIWESINRIYTLFIERVADSRQMDTETVDAIGGGRVWTGRQALQHKLIDELGGLDSAITKARELAGLREDSAVRLFYPDKALLPPIVEPTAAINYALGAGKILNERVMIYFPWVQW